MTVKLLTEHHLEFLSLKEAVQARLSQHLLLEITCHGSIIPPIFRYQNLIDGGMYLHVYLFPGRLSFSVRNLNNGGK